VVVVEDVDQHAEAEAAEVVLVDEADSTKDTSRMVTCIKLTLDTVLKRIPLAGGVIRPTIPRKDVTSNKEINGRMLPRTPEDKRGECREITEDLSNPRVQTIGP
jgi:hypothetical protein